MSAGQRLPSSERRIGEITKDDIRVSLVGTVVGSESNIVVLDDGTGQVNVTFDSMPEKKNGQLVRVIGRVIPVDGGVEIQGEVLQDFTGINRDNWDMVSSLWQKSLGDI